MQGYKTSHDKDLNDISSLQFWPHHPPFNPFLWPGDSNQVEIYLILNCRHLKKLSFSCVPPGADLQPFGKAPGPVASTGTAVTAPKPSIYSLLEPVTSSCFSPKQGHNGFLSNILSICFLTKARDIYAGTKHSSLWTPINCTHAMTHSYVKITR